MLLEKVAPLDLLHAVSPQTFVKKQNTISGKQKK